MQHLPFFALSSRFFKNLYSTFYKATMVFDNALTKALISIQHYTFLPMMLVARFGERSRPAAPFLTDVSTVPAQCAARPCGGSSQACMRLSSGYHSTVSDIWGGKAGCSVFH